MLIVMAPVLHSLRILCWGFGRWLWFGGQLCFSVPHVCEMHINVIWWHKDASMSVFTFSSIAVWKLVWLETSRPFGYTPHRNMHIRDNKYILLCAYLHKWICTCLLTCILRISCARHPCPCWPYYMLILKVDFTRFTRTPSLPWLLMLAITIVTFFSLSWTFW